MENYNEQYGNDLKNKIEDDAKKGGRGIDNRSGRVMSGMVLVGVGALLMARQFGAEIPDWIFTWKMLLIVIGVFVGAKHSFRGFGWMIPILIGTAFIVDDMLPEVSFHDYMWPLLIIAFGLFMIFRPRHRHRGDWDRSHYWGQSSPSTDDEIDATSVFGGTRKNIITKDFKGGDITTFFGGTDLNFMQADIQGTVTIDVTQVFGGTKLIIPPHWSLKSDVVCLFGSIEDKRPIVKESPDATKILRLSGTCIFGGIDIKSY